MRKSLNRIRKYYYDKHIDFYASIAGSLIMGTANLITTIKQFSWLTFNYCLFFYLLTAIKILMTCLNKSEKKYNLFFIGGVSLIILLVPMTVAMVETIIERDAPIYIFEWMIYLHATYGTVKFIMSIRARYKARISGDILTSSMSWISLISATYTIQMMEFALIATFDTDKSRSMFIMQFLTHGAILIFTVFVIVYMFVGFVKCKTSFIAEQTNRAK